MSYLEIVILKIILKQLGMDIIIDAWRPQDIIFLTCVPAVQSTSTLLLFLILIPLLIIVILCGFSPHLLHTRPVASIYARNTPFLCKLKKSGQNFSIGRNAKLLWECPGPTPLWDHTAIPYVHMGPETCDVVPCSTAHCVNTKHPQRAELSAYADSRYLGGPLATQLADVTS